MSCWVLLSQAQRPKQDLTRGLPRYLAVSTVDEGPFGQQVTQQGRQVPGQGRDVQDLGHPTRHVHHGLVGEAHVQGSVAPFQPAVNRFQVAER